ncbi:sulfurtransferase [Nocardia alni]|uniref:sulfurtransferase n=1 Tax=Nocardia alni TaxID=2815723 RepID=UPI001C24E10B|nr:sulfurtransferase [Nocardia alni]
MSPTGSALVSVTWLKLNLDRVVLLDASIRRGTGSEPPFAAGRTDFERTHLPGARFADLFTVFSDPESPLPFTRPSADGIRRAAAETGIDDDSTVVVYDRLTGAWAARIWWVLRSFGFDRVFVLDGGLDAWQRAGLPLESGPGDVPGATGAFTPVERPEFFVDLDTVKTLSAQPDPLRPLVCALRAEEFQGDPARPRSGHIPGSINLPFSATLDSEGLHSRNGTRVAAAALGLPVASGSVLYCGGAINAAGLALALHEIGITDVGVYDGSLAQWRADPELPLTTGRNPSKNGAPASRSPDSSTRTGR